MDRHGIFMKIAGLVEKLPAVCIFFLLMMNICLVIKKTGQTFCLKSITRKHLPIMVCFYPIVLHEGQVIGNWDKSVKRGLIDRTFMVPVG